MTTLIGTPPNILVTDALQENGFKPFTFFDFTPVGLIVMFSGTDCPYQGGAERTAEIINRVYPIMKDRGIDTRRLRLVAICTVCTKPFLKEVTNMNKLLEEIGPVRNELAPLPA